MCTDMSMLLELQMRLRRAILGGGTAEIVAAIQGDGLDPAARVGIYRHPRLRNSRRCIADHLPSRLSPGRQALLQLCRARIPARAPAAFALSRRVWRRFRRLSSPASPRARDCRTWPTSPVSNGPSISPAPCGRPLRCRQRRSLQFHRERPHTSRSACRPSLSYFASPWPIDTIWQANQEDEVPPIDLASGGASLEIRRAGDAVVWRRVDPGNLRVPNGARRWPSFSSRLCRLRP